MAAGRVESNQSNTIQCPLLLVAFEQYATAGIAAKPECSEAPAAHQAGLIDQQATSITGLADDAKTDPHPEETVPTVAATDTPTAEAVPTAGAAGTSTENAVSTAEAADAAAEGTPEPAQALTPQAETKDEAQAITPTVDTITADISEQRDGASVADASSADEDQTVTIAAAAATAGAETAASAIAATDAAAANPVTSTDGATSASAASTGHLAAVEGITASQDSASVAASVAVVMSESDHTPVDSAPSGVQRGQPDQLSSRHAFAAAQYATGNACHSFGLVMTLVLNGAVL